jgi:hypothetical protein
MNNFDEFLKGIECLKKRIFENNEKSGKMKIIFREKMKKLDDGSEIQGGAGMKLREEAVIKLKAEMEGRIFVRCAIYGLINIETGEIQKQKK